MDLLFFMHLLFVNSFFFHVYATQFVSSLQPLCDNDESYALVQFKESFIISKNASYESSAYPKVSSWKLQGETDDCCLWDGVICDNKTGHVIGLDLSSSYLSGSINSSSSLFQLLHLQRLNLSDNNFNESEIPTGFSHLTELTYLDLSSSNFSGQIPSEISQLSNLVSLFLKGNPLLKLQDPDLKSLVHNLTYLQQLDLSHVQINSTVPGIFANMTSLTFLALRNCSLNGEFPTGIFYLPNLRILSLYYNQGLRGKLPEFHHSSSLKILNLGDTSFYGELPFSIGNLDSLEELNIWGCDLFRGLIPSSFGNLAKLEYLELSYNNFSVQTLSSLPLFGKLAKLTQLGVDAINLQGEIPSSIASLTNLVFLSMHSNKLTGQIPSVLRSLSHLELLDLSSNKLEGPIPSSISELENMKYLSFHTNNLSGLVELEMFSLLNNLTSLLLSFNNLTVLPWNSSHASFEKIGLASCNLYEFPNFLNNQDNLQWLDLSQNHIQGQIPKWMCNAGTKTLMFMNLSHNTLTGFDQQCSAILPWKILRTLDLRFNMFQGSLPIPPPASMHFCLASNNRLDGEISPLICNLSSLQVLDLSNNSLSGILPQCLGNLSNSLLVLNLQNNSFEGHTPQTYTNGCRLKMVDFSRNQLHEQVPRSLVNCKMLEFLDLGKNYIHDIFPSWLGNLSELKVRSLSSNEFQGALPNPSVGFEFSNIHIVDLSYNNFTGKLPSGYFQSWKALKFIDKNQATYMQERIIPDAYFLRLYYGDYHYSLTLHNKGIERLYPKILEVLKSIDFSHNNFDGEIPSSIGNLKGLHLLKLSSNCLHGHIPSTLGDLKELESLDLSCNKLSGDIPQDLIHLNFLGFFNVSHNHLIGPIPRGRQFDTFLNNSYEGNSGLCGIPLSKQCGNSEISPTTPSTFKKDQDSGFPNEFIWKIVAAIRYGGGFVIGVIFEHHKVFIKNWFVKTFRRR